MSEEAVSVRRKAYFNRAAHTWDQTYRTPGLLSFLERLVSNMGLRPGHAVLDVGTGTGVLIPFLTRAVGPSGSVTAIDYAEKMVQICRKKYGHLENVSIELQDVEDLSQTPESFEAVFCFALFPHIENKEKALANLHRVLKPGGRLIIAHALSSNEVKARHHNKSSAVASDVLPEETEMRQLLQNSGFTETSVSDERGLYLCTSTKTRGEQLG